MKICLKNILVSAIVLIAPFLGFHLELMTGRIITPAFGGAASVWLLLLICFQIFLLAGYFYVFLIQKLDPPKQISVHKIVLLSAVLFAVLRMTRYNSVLTPLSGPSSAHIDTVMPALIWLISNLALPLIVLFSTSILLISWNLTASKWPHRLFALSNVGSMLGLILYPAVTERYSGLTQQTQLWSYAFIALLIIFFLTILKAAPHCPPNKGAPSPVKNKTLPFLISAFTAFLLSVVTGISCENIAPAPFLWILPLTGYLISFVLAFRSKTARRIPLTVTLIMAMFSAFFIMHPARIGLLPFLTLINISFTLIALHLHREIAEMAPESQSPSYYLLIAAGGATGTFCAVTIPVILNSFYQAEVIAAAVLLPVFMMIAEKTRKARIILAGFLFVLVLPWSYIYMNKLHDNQIFSKRNFYGTVRVVRKEFDDGNEVTLLIHGNVEHGRQFWQGHLRLEATTYYSTNGGVATAFTKVREKASDIDTPLHIGCVGLGIGTISVYGQAEDSITYYEINPAVTEIAQNPEFFSYLHDTEAKVTTLNGDARLVMQRQIEEGEKDIYDLLIIDAFSSGAIPTHLLTEEAFGIYLQLLKPKGILALHITNMHVDLKSVVAPMARHLGLNVDFIEDEGLLPGAKPSLWAILYRDKATTKSIQTQYSEVIWTDDYIDLLSNMKWLKKQY